jgi:FkbM family methyltransferase
MMDVGARGGLDEDFLPVAWATNAIGLEPEPDECIRLNLKKSSPWRCTKYLPVAVGAKTGQATLHIPDNFKGSSLLPHNIDLVESYGYDTLHRTQRKLGVECLTIDAICERFNLSPPDYLKMDVEGAELDILRSANRALEGCSAIKVEVSFLEQRLHQPLMHEVTAFLLDAGYLLADIRNIHSWRRRPLPSHPYIARWNMPYSRGIAAQCDLVFLRKRDSVAQEDQLDRLVMVSAALGFFDYSVSVLRSEAKMAERMSEITKADVVAVLASVSRRMGRAASLRAMVSRVRSMLPLWRSVITGLPVDTNIWPGY